jgi:hypothetical protein
MGSLTFRDLIGSLLNTDDLKIPVDSLVMDKFHAMLGMTVRTVHRLSNTTNVNFSFLLIVACHALEDSNLEFRDELTASDNHTLDGDKCIDLMRVKETHVSVAIDIKGSNTDLGHLLFVDKTAEGLTLDIVNNHVHKRDNLTGEVDKVNKKLVIVLSHSTAIDVERCHVSKSELFKDRHVHDIASVRILVVLEEVSEVTHSCFHLNSGTPDDSAGHRATTSELRLRLITVKYITLRRCTVTVEHVRSRSELGTSEARSVLGRLLR